MFFDSQTRSLPDPKCILDEHLEALVRIVHRHDDQVYTFKTTVHLN